jgi:hypothetical protein
MDAHYRLFLLSEPHNHIIICLIYKNIVFLHAFHLIICFLQKDVDIGNDKERERGKDRELEQRT